VGGAVVRDDEDDIALVTVPGRRQLAEVNAAGPILRHLNGNRRLPAAFAESFLPERWRGLRLALERTEGSHQTPAQPLVIPKAVDIDVNRRRLGDADEHLQLVSAA